MLTAQRQQLIRDELADAGRVVSGELAQRFGLSEDTIRRDLRQMAAAGECQRVYGGAVAPSAGSLAQRHLHETDEKARLARQAVKLVSPGQTILIDAGSTNSAIARVLPTDMGLTVVTNAPNIASSLAVRRDIQLIVLGGAYDTEIGACLGPQTVAAIADIRANWLFLGSCGVDAEIGITAFDAGEAAVKRAMVQASRLVAVAITNEKLGTTASYRVLETPDIDVMIADRDDRLTNFAQRGVTLSVTP